jgi:hypothetical protein
LCFVVLAHAHPPALADLVENLQLLHPEARVAVFNGGTDPELILGIDVEVVPTSRPMRHGHLALFHALCMEWLADKAFDHLVTLDSDVLAVRPGLADVLDADHLGAHLSQVLTGTPWRPGRRFLRSWPDWQPLFRVDHPWRCFNPVQVFSRRYVEAYLSWPRRGELLDRLHTTRMEAVEEIVWPTLARTLDLQAVALPGGAALTLSRHGPQDLERLLESPDVFFVHKVGMAYDDTDRRLIREHLRGQSPDFDVAADYAVAGAESPLRTAAAWVKDVAHVVQRRR